MRSVIMIFGMVMVVLTACKKGEAPPPTDWGYDYWPYQKGYWVEYDVDTIKVTGFESDTLHYTVREEVVDYQVLPDRSVHCFWHCFSRNADSAGWDSQISSITTCFSPQQAERVVNNCRVIHLIFPLVPGAGWNGNALNNLGLQEFSCHNAGVPAVVSGLSFEHTAKILQKDYTSMLSVDYAEEVYAKGVGLISSKKTFLQNIQSPQYKTGYYTSRWITSWSANY